MLILQMSAPGIYVNADLFLKDQHFEDQISQLNENDQHFSRGMQEDNF
jgi:hypothetical protein